MAYIIGDSFDPYASLTDIGAGYWDLAVGATLSTTTRFGAGQSLSINSSNTLVIRKTIPSGGTESTLFAALSFRYNGTFSSTIETSGVQFLDSATPQVTVMFRSDGVVIVRSGGTAGTIIGTFSSAYSANVWVHFQIKVVIHNTAGEVHIRVNGNTSDDFAVTGVNTRGGTSNNYATQCGLVAGSSTVANLFDDLLFYGSSGSAPNDWVGDIRATWQAPTGDTAQKQFSPSPTNSTAFGVSVQSSTNTLTTNLNQVRTSVILTAPVGGTLGKATVNFNAGFTGNAKVGLYDSDGAGSTPGTLLATSNQVTNPVTGTNDFTFASPPLLTIGHQYYLAIISDTTYVTKGGALGTLYTVAQTYGSGFPSSLSAATSSSLNQPLLFGTITATNSGCVQELIEDGAVTYVFDSTAGHFDLYDIQDLTATPASIIGVNVRAFGSKSDAGARSGTVTLKSGATSQDGATVALATTFQNLALFLPTDPNTSAAWTAAAINALQVGPKVVS